MSTASATPALIKKIGAMHVQAVAGINFSVADESGSTVAVTMQAVDADGNDLKRVVCLRFYMATDVLGQIEDAAMSTAPAIGTDGLLIRGEATTNGFLTFEADGDCDIDFVDTGTGTGYLIVVLPDGSLAVSGAITHT